MEFRVHHCHAVSDKVLPQLRPFMAAFMSYFVQTSNRNRSQCVKSVNGMFWRFAKFLGYIDEGISYSAFMPHLNDFVSSLIRDYVTKENGIVMTSIEQFELFAQIVNSKGYQADVYLYQQGHKKPLSKTNEHEFSPHFIPIVRLLDGRFAATSPYSCYTIDFKKRELRIETQKMRREKRIAKYKKLFSTWLVNNNSSL